MKQLLDKIRAKGFDEAEVRRYGKDLYTDYDGKVDVYEAEAFFDGAMFQFDKMKAERDELLSILEEALIILEENGYDYKVSSYEERLKKVGE